MKKINCLAPLFLILILNTDLYPQNPLLKHYTKKDGLPSSTIYQPVQDKEGFIWFGTDVGVTRFDGKKFQNFTISDGLSDNHILVVKTDSKGRVWFLGDNGTVSYWFKGNIHNADNDSVLQHIKASNAFVDLFEEHENRLWFISMYEHIILDNHSITRIRESSVERAGMVISGTAGPIIVTPKTPFFSQYILGKTHALKLHYKMMWQSRLLRLQDGGVLFLSYDEGVVWQADTIQKLIFPIHNAFYDIILGNMALTKDSLLWITVTGKGLFCYDLKNKKADPVIYFKDQITTGVLTDRDGNTWISSRNDGLYMMPAWFNSIKLFNKEIGLQDNSSYAIHKLNNGQLIVAQDKGKLYLIANNRCSEIHTPDCKNESNMVHHIISRNDDVWIASDCGLLHLNAKNGCNHFVTTRIPDRLNVFSNTNILNVKDIALSDHTIYILGGYRIFEYPVRCPGNSVYQAIGITPENVRSYGIYHDRSGRIWYSTIEGLKSFKNGMITDYSSEGDVFTKHINAINETNDSVLVFATDGYGIVFYKNGKTLYRITTSEGLCNDICRKVSVFKDRIYVSTSSGVSVLNYSLGKVTLVRNLNEGNSLPSDDVYDVFADEEDISVATKNGIAVITQKEFEKIRPVLPVLSITEIRVNDSIIVNEGKSIFSFRENSLEISFVGINYLQAGEVNYRYRLKDNKPWILTANNSVDFSSLEPGDYNFQLQARIQNGDWGDAESFSFIIRPPYWNTVWFRLGLILVFLLFSFGMVKHRLKIHRRKQEDEAKIGKKIAELEQRSLQTMMNPHFIFNVMNSIQQYINVNDKEAANNYLADFARLIRMYLSISYKKEITLDEEIDYLHLYLKFEKLRLRDKLTYEIITDPAIDTNETTISVMMIQPFIENAVWHGISPMKTPGHVLVQIDRKSEDLIRIRVEDNGIGIDPKFLSKNFASRLNESHGLSMTMQRLILLEKSSGHHLYIHYKHLHPEKQNRGTITELILPANVY